MEKVLVMIHILNKISFHPLFYLITIVMLITGLFKHFILFLFIIITHELGHLLAILIFKWHIKEIVFLPFGGLILIEDDINKPLIEEFIITLMGPLFQLIILYLFPRLSYISIPLLLFNLIPLYPLDGFKIVNIFFNKIIPFKYSYLLSLIISFILTFILLFYFHNFLVILSLILILFKTYEAYKIRKHYFNRFLLERHLKNLIFRKKKVINGLCLDHMYRDYKHDFFFKNKYYDEKEILNNLFDFKGKVC